MTNFIKENIIACFGVPHKIISDIDTPSMNREVRKMLEFYQVKHHRSLPIREWASCSNEQDPHQNHQQNELTIQSRLGNAPGRHIVGLSEFTKIYHRIFSFLLSIQNRSC